MTANHLTALIAAALDRVPPVWPVTNFVAVNPYAGLAREPFAQACRRLERAAGAAPLLAASDYLALYDRGEVTDADLAAVAPAGVTPVDLHRALTHSPAADPIQLLSEYADTAERRSHWAPFIGEEISRWCGVCFDRNQTTWTSPWRGRGLFAGWKEAGAHDLNPEVFGLRRYRATVRDLPAEPRSVVAAALTALRVPEPLYPEFLHHAALSVAGWMGHARYKQHEARLRGSDSSLPLELLAIRLAMELALFQSERVSAECIKAWQSTLLPSGTPADIDPRVVWQRAYEHHYQFYLADALCTKRPRLPETATTAQVVFCIDVRSEPLRRHLERAAPSVQTIGFAGFFGFAVEHSSPVQRAATARCPVLLAPSIPVLEYCDDGPRSAERDAVAGAALAFQNSAASTFSFVETLGLALAPSIATPVRRSVPRAQRSDLRFDESPAGLKRLAATAAAALRGMGLTRDFAPLVVLCAHGSRSTNNPYASSLDCGACGGHAGDVNARFAARVLNHPVVREHLAEAGIVISPATVFVAALHDTLTDAVCILDFARVPLSHHAALAALTEAFQRAGEAAAAERANISDGDDSGSCHADNARRAVDASEIRPEWGLANNAAILLAPRARSRGLNLHGRVFLHDYHAGEDRDGTLLEFLLAAPVVVASWINLQYYASRIDSARYGAGRKVLHNVVGGLGVVEGSGGDLRVGLPWESIHDGIDFRHEPRRLTVFVETSRACLARALAAKSEVRQLFDHEWIHLVAIESDMCHQYTSAGWKAWSLGRQAEMVAA